MSKKYTGYTCAICNQPFTDDDDVVACPECGTPFHRACYDRVGHCPFEEQHDTMAPWSETAHARVGGAAVETGPELICTRCGRINPSDGLFCTQCGSPLSQNFQTSGQQQPFSPLFGFPQTGNPTQNNPQQPNQPTQPPINPYSAYSNPYTGTNSTGIPNPKYINEEERKEQIGDYTAEEISDAVGENPRYFLRVFRRFSRSSFPLSSNLSAFFVGPFYFFYRKMYVPGSIFFALQMGFHALLLYCAFLTIPYTTELTNNDFLITVLPQHLQNLYTYASTYMSFLLFLGLLSGLFFNFFYKNKISRLIDKSRTMHSDQPDQQRIFLKEQGGINKNLAIGMFALVVAIYFIAIFILPLFVTL